MQSTKDTGRADRLAAFDAARTDSIDEFLDKAMEFRTVLINESLPEFHGEWVWKGNCLHGGCDWASTWGGAAALDELKEEAEVHAAEHVDTDLPHVAALATRDLMAEWHADQCACRPFPASCLTWPGGVPEPTWWPPQVLAAAGPWIALADADDRDRVAASFVAEQARYREVSEDLAGLTARVAKLTTHRQALTELAELVGWPASAGPTQLAVWMEKFAQHRAPVEEV